MHTWIARVMFEAGTVVSYRRKWADMPLFLQREYALIWAKNCGHAAASTIELSCVTRVNGRLKIVETHQLTTTDDDINAPRIPV